MDVNKNSGTKTIHVNGLLRLSMYAKRFGAPGPEAPQGLERRMPQPTAITTRSTAIRRAAVLQRSIVRPRPKKHVLDEYRSPRLSWPGLSSPSLPHPRPSSLRPAPRRHTVQPHRVFCSRDPNCLDMPGAAFHYSVIGRNATVAPAAEYTCRRPLNDAIPALKSRRGVSTCRSRSPAPGLQPCACAWRVLSWANAQ